MVHRSLCYILPGVIPRIRLQHVARVKGFSDIIMDPNKLTLHKKEIILSGPVLTVGSPLKKNLGLPLRSISMLPEFWGVPLELLLLKWKEVVSS